MTKAAYSHAAYPEPFTILGLRLKPLSLQHYLLMSRFEVAFVAEGEAVATFDDLVTGVLICSKHWKEGEFEEYIGSDQWKKDVEEWGGKIGILTVNEQNEKIQLFQEFIKEGSEVPQYSEENDGKSSSAHWTQCLILTLTRELGYTRRDALRCPLKQALADYFHYAESQGLIKLFTAADFAAADANSAAIEAQLKGQI